jgi:ABC-type glycerol-3-phosphate transport system substrate-binding protein
MKRGILVLVAFMVAFTLAAQTKPTKIKIYKPGIAFDTETDPILKVIEKKLNIDMDFVTAPWDQSMQKATLIINSGEDMDVVHGIDFTVPWDQWARDGVMTQLDSFITKEKTPYLHLLTTSQTFKPLYVDGKRFYTPINHHGADWVFFIREDWLKKLNLKMPTTLDELYTVAKAFTFGDPDGNGQADTVGFQNEAIVRSWEPVLFAHGVSAWLLSKKPMGIRNGKVYHEYVTEGAKAALKYMNRLNREGILNTDWPLTKNLPTANSKYWDAGKAGMAWMPLNFSQKIRQDNPNAKIAAIPPLKAAPGFEYVGTRGMEWYGMVGYPKSSKVVAKSLELNEFVNTLEGRELFISGVKGQHWTKRENGVFDRNRDTWNGTTIPAVDLNARNGNHFLATTFFCISNGYLDYRKWPTFELATKNFEFWVDDFSFKNDPFNAKTGMEFAAQYAGYPGELKYVELKDVAEIGRKLDTEVQKVYWQKMNFAKTDAEFEALWTEYLDMWKRTGGDQYVAAYQAYYDKYLK